MTIRHILQLSKTMETFQTNKTYKTDQLLGIQNFKVVYNYSSYISKCTSRSYRLQCSLILTYAKSFFPRYSFTIIVHISQT